MTSGAKEHAVPRTGKVAIPAGRDSSAVKHVTLKGGGESCKPYKHRPC